MTQKDGEKAAQLRIKSKKPYKKGQFFDRSKAIKKRKRVVTQRRKFVDEASQLVMGYLYLYKE